MILHSKITPECPQITTDHTKRSQNHEVGTDIFSLLGLIKQVFFTAPSPNMGQIPDLNLSTRLLKYSIPSTWIRMGNLTNSIVELNSNPITWLQID